MDSSQNYIWPGLASYKENDSHLFFGRDIEKSELTRKISSSRLTIVYGASGTGKTSLLQAGVYSQLRSKKLLPVAVRIRFTEQVHSIVSLGDQLKDELIKECKIQKIELIHTDRPYFSTRIQQLTIWEWLRSIKLSKNNELWQPVFLFDQFEEVFTVGKHVEGIDSFITELGGVAEGFMPSEVAAFIDAYEGEIPDNIMEQPYKVVISLREDYLAQLQGLKNILPGATVRQNHFALNRLNGSHALEAVLKPAPEGTITTEVAEEIVRFVANASDSEQSRKTNQQRNLEKLEVEPAILSLICQQLDLKRKANNELSITTGFVLQSRDQIMVDFYEDCMKIVSVTTRYFIEDRMIDAEGFRTSEPEVNFGGSNEQKEEIQKLINIHLLHRIEHYQRTHLELCHDVLTKVVKQSRNARHEKQALEDAKIASDKAEAERKRRIEAEKLAAIAKAAREEAEALVVFLVTEVSGKLDAREHLQILSPLADRLKLHFDKMDKTTASAELLKHAVYAYLQVAEVREREGRFGTASESYGLAIECAEQYRRFWNLTDRLLMAKVLICNGKTLLSELDKPEEGLQALRRATDVLTPVGNEDNPIIEPYSQSMVFLIEILKNHGQADEAERLNKDLHRQLSEPSKTITENKFRFGLFDEGSNMNSIRNEEADYFMVKQTNNKGLQNIGFNHSNEINKLISAIINITKQGNLTPTDKTEQWTPETEAKYRNQYLDAKTELLLHTGDIQRECSVAGTAYHLGLILWEKAWADSKKESDELLLQSFLTLDSIDKSNDRRIPGSFRKVWTQLKFTCANRLIDYALNNDIPAMQQLIEGGMPVNLQNENWRTAAMTAAANGKHLALRYLIEAGADLEIRNSAGENALLWACQEGQFESVEILLKHGVNVHALIKEQTSSLLLAVKQKRKDLIALLLDYGFNINSKNSNGWTALLFAVAFGYKDIVDYLLENGAGIHYTINNGSNNLMIAANQNQKEMVAYLLEKGFDIEFQQNDGWTAMMFAVSKGHIEIVDLLLENGADIHCINIYGHNNLIIAAANNQKEMVAYCLEKGFDIEFKDNDGCTALMNAVSKGYKDIVELLLENGADINCINNNGRTALMDAVSKGNKEIVDLLIEKGADIHYVKNNGSNNLIIAAANNQKEMVTFLLEKGFDIEFKDNKGWTALMHAVGYGYKEIVDLLIENEADIHCLDNDGSNNLMISAGNNQKEMVAYFLEKGFDIEFKDNNGWTAMMHAVRYGYKEIVDLLVENGAEIQCIKNDGVNNLIIAAANNQKEMVAYLLEKGFDIEFKDNNGWTALMHAVSKGHIEIVDLLIEKGADIRCIKNDGVNNLIIAAANNQKEMVAYLLEKDFNIEFKDNRGWTALMNAVADGYKEIVDLLLENSADIHCISNNGVNNHIIAAANNQKEMVAYLLEKGFDIELKDNNGWTALMNAVAYGYKEIVDLLLENGADIHCISNNGSNNFIIAAAHNQKEMVAYLLEKGFDIEFKNNNGWTTLMDTVSRGYREIVDLLLENGADVYCRNNYGHNNLMIAAGNNQKELVAFLLEKGFDIEFKDNLGWTPIMHAALNNHPDIVMYLISCGVDKESFNYVGSTSALIGATNGNIKCAELLLNVTIDELKELVKLPIIFSDFSSVEKYICAYEITFKEEPIELAKIFEAFLLNEELKIHPFENFVIYLNQRLCEIYTALMDFENCLQCNLRIVEAFETLWKSKPVDPNKFNTEIFEASTPYYLILNRNFKEALALSKSIILKYPDSLNLKSNLMHSFIFNDFQKEAMEICIQSKRKLFLDGRTWEEGILEDFDYLEKNGIHHPDFEKVKALLKTE